MSESIEMLGIAIMSFYVLAAFVSAVIFVMAKLWQFASLARHVGRSTEHGPRGGN